jgi:methyl-accepting chemotaxis protein
MTIYRKKTQLKVQEALSTGESTYFYATSKIDKIKKRFEITPIRVADRYWCVCSVVPVKEITNAAAEIVRVGIIVGLIALIITVVIMLIIGLRIVRPLKKLTQVVKTIETAKSTIASAKVLP